MPNVPRASIVIAGWPFNCWLPRSLRQAFDLDLESRETRDLYGMTLFGQAALTARRLVEAGGRFVTVFWDEYGLAGTGWDTHWDHFPRMKDELLPGLDRTLSGLLMDLDRRGLLDETLVVLLSEHGRTPRIQSNVQGRRPRSLVAVLLGGDGGRRHRPGPGDRPVRQDRQRPGRAQGLAQGHPRHDLPPAGHRPDRTPHRPPGPSRCRSSPRPRFWPRRWGEHGIEVTFAPALEANPVGVNAKLLG